jgi:precorrin-4/cobalt-precorrin-4 C11-methyltransferase
VRSGPRVLFVGAGPGDPDLLTLRGARAIAEADVIVWAGSLVNPAILRHARPDAEAIDSSALTLEEVLAVYERAAREGLVVARVHSGDPALYGAIAEQIEHLEAAGIPWAIVPGVSSLTAAAAAIGRELTVPGVSQSVVITRLATRTPGLPGESVRSFAAHGATMALFLSAARPEALQRELLAGGYRPETPCAVVHRASWPDQRVLRCPLSELAGRMRRARIHRTALVLVGPALAARGARSRLYDPSFGHSHRRPRAPGGARGEG